jgi:hypothetical protein
MKSALIKSIVTKLIVSLMLKLKRKILIEKYIKYNIMKQKGCITIEGLTLMRSQKEEIQAINLKIQ